MKVEPTGFANGKDLRSSRGDPSLTSSFWPGPQRGRVALLLIQMDFSASKVSEQRGRGRE